MSVSAEIETRSRTNVLSVPIMAVTTRLPKNTPSKKEEKEKKPDEPVMPAKLAKKEEGPKPSEVVFLLNGDLAKVAKVKTGISDDSYMEITEGLHEGEEIISGGYAAISRQLEDGKKIKKGNPEGRKKPENKES